MGKMSNKDIICSGCGAKEGGYHISGCNFEVCPFCGGQLSSCGCCYKILHIDVSIGTWAYENGLTEEQDKQWDKLLKRKGLVPFISIPVLCALCGKLNPQFFHVPDNEWYKYVIPGLQKEALCLSCYDKQKSLFPDGWCHLDVERKLHINQRWTRETLQGAIQRQRMEG